MHFVVEKSDRVMTLSIKLTEIKCGGSRTEYELKK